MLSFFFPAEINIESLSMRIERAEASGSGTVSKRAIASSYFPSTTRFFSFSPNATRVYAGSFGSRGFSVVSTGFCPMGGSGFWDLGAVVAHEKKKRSEKTHMTDKPVLPDNRMASPRRR